MRIQRWMGRPRASRIAQAIVTVAALAVAGVMVTAAPAAAHPTSCSTSDTGSYVAARCTSGTGRYAVMVKCEPYSWNFWGSAHFKTGNWAVPGWTGSSSVDCGWGYDAIPWKMIVSPS